MRASDIKVGHVYNVIFDPVRDNEFNGKHLAVVLKKNNDKSTFIVMPLTSASNGSGINKLYIGKLDSLPKSLKNKDTYAVLNQIRTVNSNRFISLKEENNIIEVIMPINILNSLYFLAIREIIYSMDQDCKILLLKKAYEYECIEKAKDIAYHIIKLKRTSNTNDKNIEQLENQIKKLLKGITYNLDEKFIKDGINEIFINALNQ